MVIKELLWVICWLKELQRTVELGLPVSGHDFIDKEGYTECEVCGYKRYKEVYDKAKV